MASRDTHDLLGFLLGTVVAAAACARREPQASLDDLLLEALGGGLAGILGSRLPDILEPPTSSWHRSTMHSAAVTGVVAYGSMAKAPLIAQKMRTPAMGESAGQRGLRRLAAGALQGLPAGYVSHTIADATTPRGIPLLTRGF